MAKVLTDEQLQFYAQNKYLLVKGALPPEAIHLARTISSRWMDKTISQWVNQGLLPDLLREIDFEHRLVHAWHAAGCPRYSRSPRRDLVSREMYDYLVHSVSLDLAEDLLGTPEISVHGVFNLRPKLPDQKWTDTPWHQDAQYYKDAEHTHVISMWSPMQPVSEHNSCLQVAPGFFVDRVRDGVIDEETGFLGLTKEDSAKLTGISIEMEPGDILCFNQLLPHRALPNRSDAVRWSMDLRYEATEHATESGKQFGFVARSLRDPSSVTPFDEWLTKWETVPEGAY